MKILITGGHLSPALAVIDKLKNDEVFYAGRKNVFEGDLGVSLEYEEITKRGIPFFPVKTGRLQRKFTRYTIPSVTRIPFGLLQSIFILRKTKPDVILGFGGYIQIPVTLAANILKIPVVIHEQTLEAGMGNKLAHKFAKKVCISWESSKDFFPKEKTVLTGNPLRKEILNVKEKTEKNRPLKIYITGGSGGSHFINTLVENNIKELKKFSILHQTGDAREFKDFDRLKKFESKNYKPVKFLNPKESADAINSSDLVIGRSGINTVSELIYLKKPSFLIPLPFGQRNEQLKNAQFIKSLGISEYEKQDSLTGEQFMSTVFGMLSNIESYKLKEDINLENASEKIIEVLRDVSKTKTA
jgi:UDP-N-acetylglucosamine--N-acetylmuramyl-(pentapeptide) pyrophosphoryl-undecaprenol N-acetylglucosamine transferase